MEKTRVAVSLGSHSYEVIIGRDLAGVLADCVADLKPTATVVVTDTNVGPKYAAPLARAINAQSVVTVHAGEESKSLPALGTLYDRVLAARSLDRQSLIIALGGGVVGDLAGFLAATLYRGMRYVQVPTSLLAMVDSSVGGKTGINHSTGKNLIGAFHQPAAVICDLCYLDALPEREYVSALAEVVKTAALAGPALFGLIERDGPDLLARDPAALVRAIEACVRFKADVVAADERETTGRRALLNLGHSVAHVLESAFPNRYLHGEAVSIGLAAAMRLSTTRAGLPGEVAGRMLALLARLKLPTEAPRDLSAGTLLNVLASDKKRSGGVVHFIVLTTLGTAQRLPCVLDAELATLLLGASGA